jgi:hypothetical protein
MSERELFPSTTKPWDIDAALKPKRLVLLARAAVDTRNQALAEANREAGDTNWGIGCKAHERFAHSVAKLAETSERSWLRVHRDGLAFTSYVEGVAVRAFRGEADHPSARHVYAAQLESESEDEAFDKRQLALPFAWQPPPQPKENDPAERWVWLMAVETDAEGRAVRVVFFQANALGHTRHRWIAPLAGEAPHPTAPATVRGRTARGAHSRHSPRVSARI